MKFKWFITYKIQKIGGRYYETLALEGFLNQLSAADLSQFRKEHLEEIEQYNTDKGLWLNINTLFTTAKK